MTDLYDAQDYLPHQTRADDLIRRGDTISQLREYLSDTDSMIAWDVEQIIAALPAVAAPGVRVKPLVWIDFEGKGAKAQAWNQANYMIKLWSDGRYEISASYPGYSTFIEGTERWYDTLASAKAAAQADYEARIIAALDTPAPALMDELVEALRACVASLERADTAEGVCCCGDDMERHTSPMDSGHTPTDMGEYYAGKALTAAAAALAKWDAK